MAGSRAPPPVTPSRAKDIQSARKSTSGKSATAGTLKRRTPNSNNTPSKTIRKTATPRGRQAYIANKTAKEEARNAELSSYYDCGEDDDSLISENEHANKDDEEAETDHDEMDVDEAQTDLDMASKDIQINKDGVGLTTGSAVAVPIIKQDVKNNGRHKGRQLIKWSTAADQLLLLTVQYECYKHGIIMPWEAIAKRFAPEKSPTTQCLVQHLSKLRSYMLDSGRWVPPLMGRKEQKHMFNNQDVRGNVRYFENGVDKIRDIQWDEDASMLVNPHDIQPLPPTRTPGGRKLYLADDGVMVTTENDKTPSASNSKVTYTQGSAKRTPRAKGATTAKGRRSKVKLEDLELDNEMEGADPDAGCSDDDYEPGKKKTPTTVIRRGARGKNFGRPPPLSDEESDEESDEDSEDGEDTDQDDQLDLSVRQRRQLSKPIAFFSIQEQESFDKFRNERKIVKLRIDKSKLHAREYKEISYYDSGEITSDSNAGFAEDKEVVSGIIGNCNEVKSQALLTTATTASAGLSEANPFMDASTPFDEYPAGLTGNLHTQVRLHKEDGTAYPGRFSRIASNFNNAVIDAATAKVLWLQEMDDVNMESAAPTLASTSVSRMNQNSLTASADKPVAQAPVNDINDALHGFYGLDMSQNHARDVTSALVNPDADGTPYTDEDYGMGYGGNRFDEGQTGPELLPAADYAANPFGFGGYEGEDFNDDGFGEDGFF